MKSPSRLLRFASFEFDPNLQELRRNGLRVRLSASQLRLLTLFLEHPGQLLTREIIEQRIWTETGTINVRTGINTAINRLRDNLRDSSSKPQFIETVIGLGYRFIASVEEVSVSEEAPLSATVAEPSLVPYPELLVTSPAPARPEPAIAPPAPWYRRYALQLSVAITVLLVTAAVLGIRSWSSHRRATKTPPVSLIFTPVTHDNGTNKVTQEAVSPDGTMIAYADDFGITLQNLVTGTAQALAPLEAMDVHRIDWLPNQSAVIVSARDREANHSVVRLVPINNAYAINLSDDADMATVSPDGSSFAFVRKDATEVWVSHTDGQQARRLYTLKAGQTGQFLLWSGESQRLMLAWNDVRSQSSGIDWIDAQTGHELAHEQNVALNSAILTPGNTMEFLSHSKVGELIFAVPLAKEDGHFLSAPKLIKVIEATSAHSLTASRDAKRLAIVLDRGVTQTFLATLQKGPHGTTLDAIQQLTYGPYDAYPHAWGKDNTLYFESQLPGDFIQTHTAIFVQRPAEISPQVFATVPKNALMAQPSPDGRWILFLTGSGRQFSVYRVPTAGGKPEQVPTNGPVQELHCARVEQGGCVIRKAIENQALVYDVLDPLKGIGRELVRTAWEPTRLGDWGLSPDGHTVITAVHDTLHPLLHIIPVDGSKPSEMPFKGPGTPLGVHWTGDGRGLFVESRTDSGYCLSLMDWAGHTETLRTSHKVIWAIAAPTGSRIAFPDYTTNSNVWTSITNSSL